MNVSVFVSTFLAASIEVIEMVAIIVAVGVTRQWRGALAGTFAGLSVLAVLVAGLGTALQSVPLTPLRLVVGALLLVFGAANHAIASAAVAAATSLLLIGGLGAASYRLVARIPRRALQMFFGALLTTFGTFWAGEGLRVNWPGNDLSLLWLSAVYVAAGLVMVRVVSDWRRGTARRP